MSASSSKMRVHPVYGEYLVDTWVKLVAHRTFRNKETCEYDFVRHDDGPYEIRLVEDKEFPCEIRRVNKKTPPNPVKLEIKESKWKCRLFFDKTPQSYCADNMMLASFFPTIKAEINFVVELPGKTSHRLNQIRWDIETADEGEWRSHPTIANLEVSSHGLLKLNGILTPTLKSTPYMDTEYYRREIRIDGKHYYLHTLVGQTFYPEGDYWEFEDITDEMHANRILRCFAEDLIPLFDDTEFDEQESIDEHPVYGKYWMYRWIPIKEWPYEMMIVNNRQQPCLIRGIATERCIKFSSNRACLSQNGTKQYFDVFKLMLKTCFPNVPENETVDHISNDHTDNRLFNLQWLSRSDNSKKNKNQCRKRGVEVVIRFPNGLTQEVPSIDAAADAIQHLNHGKRTKEKLQSVAN